MCISVKKSKLNVVVRHDATCIAQMKTVADKFKIQNVVYPRKCKVDLQFSNASTDTAAFAHSKRYRGIRVACLATVQPALRDEIIWLREMFRVMRCCIVAESDQSL